MRKDRIANELASIDLGIDRLAAAVETLAAPPPPPRIEQHFHAKAVDVADADLDEALEPYVEPTRWEAAKAAGFAELDRERPGVEVTHPTARIAVLSVALNLKNRLDAKRVFDGENVLEVIDAYHRVQELRQLLGAVTDEELELAAKLYDELAS